ncbi:MAG: hypothetical protein HRU09_09175 [Oligoflexales bacterium]|nr:hypothetical protein [Oligoflexales bacterium]
MARLVKGATEECEADLYESTLRGMQVPDDHYLKAIKKWYPSLITLCEVISKSGQKLEAVKSGYEDLLQRMMVSKPIGQEFVEKAFGVSGAKFVEDMAATGLFKINNERAIKVNSKDGVGNIGFSRSAACDIMAHNSRMVINEPSTSNFFYRVLSLPEEKAAEFWVMAAKMRDFIDRYARDNKPGDYVLAVQTIFRQIEI